MQQVHNLQASGGSSKQVHSKLMPALSNVTVDTLWLLYSTCHGEEWSHNANWNVQTDVCAWEGVVCDNETKALTGLALANLFVNGRALDVQLELLASLATLDLSTNRIYGTVPPELGSMLVLTDLDVSGNQVSACMR